MQRTSAIAVAAAACLTLASCGDKEPVGQVVATLDGKEITAIDLRNEMSGYVASDAKARKAAEQAALDAIISRKSVAEAARKAGIDKTPEFAQQHMRAEELLLIQTWREQIAKQVPPVSKEEIDKFVAEHPDLYGARKIYELDQVRMVRPNDPTLIKALEPLKSLEEIAGVLTQRGIRFQRAKDRLDALTVDPRLVEQVARLPADEVFIVPSNNLVVINRITGTLVQPVAADVAARHAGQYLKAIRTQQATTRQFQSVVQAAKADVSYNKAYQPAPPAKATAPSAAAPAKAP